MTAGRNSVTLLSASLGSIRIRLRPHPMNYSSAAPSGEAGPTNVFMVGMMGSGKSAIGRTIADNLGLTFVDTDALVESEAGMKIPEIFATEGESRFRERESRALASLQGSSGLVIATGGGIVLAEENRVRLRSLGYGIWLTASVDVLLRRISLNRDRPLMQTANPRERLVALLDQRKPLYEEVADMMVDTTDLTPAETVHGLVECINYHFASASCE